MDTLDALIIGVESIASNYKSIHELLDTVRQDNQDSLPVYELGKITLEGTPLVLMMTVGTYR